ncbi:MAG: AAA family ATPase [Prevotellaceae bacterium]|nr:AAA family ATPase [Candidatus Minthosoma equi]
MSVIIGRNQETQELMRAYRRKQSQLVAVYGRRRVGKTYLVRELFKDEFAFYHTGVSPVELKDENLLEVQLREFNATLVRYGAEDTEPPTNWTNAFERLITLLSKVPKEKRMVVFLDELPWMDTPRSGFITAFEHFWNGWGAGQENMMLIVCGSATSWIQDNLINSYGGLYDRVNAEIQLSPFTLRETEEMLRMQGVTLSRYDVLQLYMAVGGIPMYLSYIEPGLSLAQIIDKLYFAHKAKLKNEFNRLFNSIFRSPDKYVATIRMLAKLHKGYSRDDISKKLQTSGKDLTKLLRTLEASDFIECYRPFENDNRHLLYRLIDPFCLFYLTQVERKRRGENFWRDNENSPALAPWRGYAFEDACLKHVEQIKKAMGVSGVASDNSAWTLQGVQDQKGMQIDLIIERSDRVINLCEMKFVNTNFEVKKEYKTVLSERLNWITSHVKKNQNVQMTLVTTYGLKQGIHSGIFQRTITLDNLFD